jgi:hypothetical protein
MRLRRPRFTVLRLVSAVAVVGVALMLWAVRSAGLDEDETAGWIFFGSCFVLPLLGIPVLFVLGLQTLPSDPPPPESRTAVLPQLTIGCLMSLIAISAIALALICLG